MSTPLAVTADGGPLSRAAVIALLSGLIGDQPALHETPADGDYTELLWDGDRVSTQWFVYAADGGIGSVEVSLWDSFPGRPVAGLRTEAARVVEVLKNLAHATGGRCLIGEADVTDTPTGAALDLIALETDESPDAAPLPPSDEDYLARFLAAAVGRRAWLEEQVGPLDLTRESLVPLWIWAVDRLRLRPDDAAKDYVVREDGARFYVPRDADLPLWYGRSPFLAPDVWSDDSLAIVDGLAAYFAACLTSAQPDLRWEIAHADYRGYMHEGQPVLIGLEQPIEPVSAVLALLTGVYHLRRPGTPNPYNAPRTPPAPQDLRNLYDRVSRI